MIALCLSVLLAQAPATGTAQEGYYTPEEAKALFTQGIAAYDAGDYAAAMEVWQRLLDRGYGGQDVLYNLGTAALKSGDLGKAVLYLERARRAGPADEDLVANLEAARQRQGDQIVGAGQSEPFVQRIVYATPGGLVAYAFLAAWLGAFAATFLFRKLRPGRRAWAGVLAGVLWLAAIPAGALLAAHVYVANTVREGVVMKQTLQARELPTPASRVSFEVHAGLKVRLLETEGAYVRIRLPNGLVGWTEKEGLAEI